MSGALGPAIEMQQALQEQINGGIDSSVLNDIAADASTFAMTYGRSAVDFVRSAGAINAAVSGLTAAELPELIRSANLIAQASGTTVQALIAASGLQQPEASRSGNGGLAGQKMMDPSAVWQRITTMMAAMPAVGASIAGGPDNAALPQQSAVINTLQRAQGAGAGSTYQGLLTMAPGALLPSGSGIGPVMPLPESLTRHQPGYGDSTYGSAEGIQPENMMRLQQQVSIPGDNSGALARTMALASSMVSPWARFEQIVNVIQTTIGLALLPALSKALNLIADTAQRFAVWMQMFPALSSTIGWVAVALHGLTKTLQFISQVMRLCGAALSGLNAVWKMLALATRLWRLAVLAGKAAVVVFNAIMIALRGTLMAVRLAALAAGVGANLISLPVLLVVAALIAGCWLLVTHWEQIKTAVMDTTAFQVVMAVVQQVAELWGRVWAFLADGWNRFTDMIINFSIMETLGNMAQAITGLFNNAWAAVRNSAIAVLNWIIDKLNHLPGIHIALIDDVEPAPGVSNTLSTGGQLRGMDTGGIQKTITAGSSTVTDNSRSIGNVYVYTQGEMTPGKLEELQEMR